MTYIPYCKEWYIRYHLPIFTSLFELSHLQKRVLNTLQADIPVLELCYDCYQSMELYYNSEGVWHYNIYNISGSVEQPYHCHQPVTDRSSPNDAPHSSFDWQQTSSCSSTCEEHSIKYSASFKVLNPTNKKQFTMLH